jgi:hypothetical protein
MTYDPNLPIPSSDDIAPLRVTKSTWTCRYCGFTESGNTTTKAEKRRCAAHEYRCPERPVEDLPTEGDRVAYQSVHAAGLRRDLVVLSCNLDDRVELLRYTWFFDFAGKREHKAEIEKLRGRIAGVNAYALALGLDDGWSDPCFRPAAIR